MRVGVRLAIREWIGLGGGVSSSRVRDRGRLRLRLRLRREDREQSRDRTRIDSCCDFEKARSDQPCPSAVKRDYQVHTANSADPCSHAGVSRLCIDVLGSPGGDVSR